MLSVLPSKKRIATETFPLPENDAFEADRRHPALGPAKRAIDIVGSLLLLVLLSPLLLFGALLVLVAMGRPMLFTQQRPGLGGRPFRLIKFRSMSDRCGADGAPLPDAERLGTVGRLLRSTSLDELPELVNVLRGDMSLVGPRPLLMEYLPLYSAEQRRRHYVRPGLTGLAQVGGRNALDWDSKFALDVRYVDQWSLALDWKILGATVWQVLTRQGISHEDHATAPRFEGNRSER
jgi:lipopolysaccharide/colanic/teichoic acid biosynthesis glycosyltransferase